MAQIRLIRVTVTRDSVTVSSASGKVSATVPASSNVAKEQSVLVNISDPSKLIDAIKLAS
jgi:hypothetical protein